MLERCPPPHDSPTRLRTRPRFSSSPTLLPLVLARLLAGTSTLDDGNQGAHEENRQRWREHVESQPVLERGGLSGERRGFHSNETRRFARRDVGTTRGFSLDVGRTGHRAHRQARAPHLPNARRSRAAVARRPARAAFRTSSSRSLPSSPQHVAPKPLVARGEPPRQVPFDSVVPSLQPFDACRSRIARRARGWESSSRTGVVVVAGNPERSTIFVWEDAGRGCDSGRRRYCTIQGRLERTHHPLVWKAGSRNDGVICLLPPLCILIPLLYFPRPRMGNELICFAFSWIAGIADLLQTQLPALPVAREWKITLCSWT